MTDVIRGINKFLILLPLTLLFSCRASRTPVSPVTPVSVSGAARTYIDTYKDLAVKEMKRSGVPASITLAQGMLESDYGRSTLARMGNNHFGIKCHDGWTGQTIRQHDDRRNECFRKYRKVEDSYYDHSEFLRTRSRYSFLFDLNQTDYKGWARGLKKAGYATNPDYANLLIKKIEENDLYNFDRDYSAYAGTKRIRNNEKSSVSPVQGNPTKTAANSSTVGKITKTQEDVADKAENNSLASDTKITTGYSGEKTDTVVSGPSSEEETITFGDVMARVPGTKENNKSQYIIVRDGDTREKIEEKYQLLRWELPKYNELKSDFKPVPGQILYLQPKRDKAEAGKEFHTAAAGETMYMISQKYGVRLTNLLNMNRMKAGDEPVPGQKIWLQNTRSAN